MKFEELKGKVLVDVTGAVEDSERIYIADSDGKTYLLYHEQDCCESVWVNDIEGNIQDLIGSPILQAEEVESEPKDDKEGYGTETWTFYKLATIKGYVTIRWLGSSNGYYSESVTFKAL